MGFSQWAKSNELQALRVRPGLSPLAARGVDPGLICGAIAAETCFFSALMERSSVIASHTGCVCECVVFNVCSAWLMSDSTVALARDYFTALFQRTAYTVK